MSTSKNIKRAGKVSKPTVSEKKEKSESILGKVKESELLLSITKRNSSIKSRGGSKDSKNSVAGRPSSALKNRPHLLGPLPLQSEPRRTMGLHSPKQSLLTSAGKRPEKPIGPLFFKKENQQKKHKPKENSEFMIPTSSNEQVILAQKTDSKFASIDDDSRKQSMLKGEMFDINREQLLKMLVSQANKKDKHSHSFLSKFSLLSSKTTIGESRHSIERKKELRSGGANGTKSPKPDLYRPSFLQKKG